MSDPAANRAFCYHLIRTYFDGDGVTLELDDFQIAFDPDAKQIRIGLSGEQVAKLTAWGWSKHD